MNTRVGRWLKPRGAPTSASPTLLLIMAQMLLLALLLAAAPGPRNPAGPGKAKISADSGNGKTKRAGMLLKMGRFVQAEEILASTEEPSPLQVFQHSQALVGMGRCTEGEAQLPHLTAKQTGLLTPRLATCYAYHQQWHRAAEWLMESRARSPETKAGQAGLLWLTLSRAGQAQDAETVAEESEAMPLMRAARAMDLGQVETVDLELVMLSKEALDRTGVHLINAQLEMDLGNLAAAEAYAKEALSGARDDVRAMAILAEARRRSGWSAGAAMAMKRKPLLAPHHPRLRPVLIRIAVDQGELERAQELLQAGLDAGFVDAELYASAWYLHEHLQDGEAALWERRWALVNTSPLRSLEQL